MRRLAISAVAHLAAARYSNRIANFQRLTGLRVMIFLMVAT